MKKWKESVLKTKIDLVYITINTVRVEIAQYSIC